MGALPRINRSILPFLCFVLGWILLFPALVGAQSTQPAGWSGPFFFIQMSDPQFGMYTSNQDFAKETENYQQAIAAANKLRPAFVVITGDLVNKAGDPAQIAELKRISAKLDSSIPLRLLPGNHDLENIPTPATLAFFRKEIGKDYYAFDHGGCRFIGLNTTILMRPDIPEEIDKEMAWLKTELESAHASKAKHTILLGHHPLFVTRPEEPDNGNSIPSFRRRAMLEMLTANHAMFMFSGHLHRNAGGKAGAFEMISTGPVGKPLGNDVSGFQIVKVFEDHIEHEYVPLDKVPGSLPVTVSGAGTKP
jgi:Icc-related predicted phosphoesterase